MASNEKINENQRNKATKWRRNIENASEKQTEKWKSESEEETNIMAYNQ